MRDYEPPLTVKGSPLIPGQEEEIYPGVRGYALQHGEEIYIPLVIGNGQGKVAEFLDACSYRCCFVCVISPKLARMLTKRGYRQSIERIRGDEVDIWRRQNPTAR